MSHPKCDCHRDATHRKAVVQVSANGQTKRVYLYLCETCKALEEQMSGSGDIEEIGAAPRRGRPIGCSEVIATYLRRSGRPRAVLEIAHETNISPAVVRATLLANVGIFERAGKRRGWRGGHILAERWIVKGGAE